MKYDEAEFEEIAEEWVRDQEILEEIRQRKGLETGASAKAGFGFWDIFAAEGFLKSFYGYENTSTEKIRRSVRRNPDQLVNRLNQALIEVRQALKKANKGQDLLFIVDDFEKHARRSITAFSSPTPSSYAKCGRTSFAVCPSRLSIRCKTRPLPTCSELPTCP